MIRNDEEVYLFTSVVPPGNAYVEIASNPSDAACD